jgi:hypothetical protein
MRLLPADYLLTDDADSFTGDGWRDSHRITKLVLLEVNLFVHSLEIFNRQQCWGASGMDFSCSEL